MGLFKDVKENLSGDRAGRFGRGEHSCKRIVRALLAAG
jgi:hypothetical protein